MIKLDPNALDVTTFAAAPAPEEPAALQPPPTRGCTQGLYCPYPVEPVTQNGCETSAAGYC